MCQMPRKSGLAQSGPLYGQSLAERGSARDARLGEVFARRERGQSLVEFAIAAFVLLLLLAGIVDLGRGFYSYVVITNAAREGTRYGANYFYLTDAIDRMEAKVITEASDSGVALDGDSTTITVCFGVSCPTESADPPYIRGDPVWIGVEFEFATILGSILGLSNITLNTSVQMIVM